MIIRDQLTLDFLSWNLGEGRGQGSSQPGCTMQVPGSFTLLIFLLYVPQVILVHIQNWKLLVLGVFLREVCTRYKKDYLKGNNSSI